MGNQIGNIKGVVLLMNINIKQFHDKSYRIEKFMKLLTKKNHQVMKADEIDIYPLVAISYCLFQLCDNCNENYFKISSSIWRVFDEVCCVIGNNKLAEPFNFIAYPEEDRQIKGDNNDEYIDSLISYLFEKYNQIMKNHKFFTYLFH